MSLWQLQSFWTWNSHSNEGKHNHCISKHLTLELDQTCQAAKEAKGEEQKLKRLAYCYAVYRKKAVFFLLAPKHTQRMEQWHDKFEVTCSNPGDTHRARQGQYQCGKHQRNSPDSLRRRVRTRHWATAKYLQVWKGNVWLQIAQTHANSNLSKTKTKV